MKNMIFCFGYTNILFGAVFEHIFDIDDYQRQSSNQLYAFNTGSNLFFLIQNPHLWKTYID